MSSPTPAVDADLRALISQNIETHSSPSKTPHAYPTPPLDKLPSFIDHTLLKADKNVQDLRELCSEAQTYSFGAICVHLEWVKLCAKFLDNRLGKWRPVAIACVIDFPDGTGGLEKKAHEAYWAVKDGARELDVVIDYPAMKDGHPEVAFEGIKIVMEKADECLNEVGGEGRVLVKVIIETCMLERDEIISACTIAKAAGADFVKTSTGFKGKGATIEHVQLMKAVVGDEIGVKASGGVRNAEDCIKMVEAGATRIGTSGGVKIMTEARDAENDKKAKAKDGPKKRHSKGDY